MSEEKIKKVDGRIGRGGKRAGSGRPKGGDLKKNIENARQQVVRRINKHKDEILKAQIEGAKGLHYLDAEKNIVFTKKPDLSTGEYLLNQLIGKPKESMEIVGEMSLKVDI
jgi:hypothetical protein